MGGNALKKYSVFTERKNTEEFKQIGYELNTRVFFDLTLFSAVVTCYHTKSDHGDLDLLICIELDSNINWKDYIQTTFNPRAIHSNGGVISFDYKGFQIDFIPIPKSSWEVAKTYFSYDPLGNIMGKTFHKFGLSYGWEGLFYKFRNFDGRLAKDIPITKDPKKIFEFGGYDYERYLKGFENLEDIFQYCIDCKYFDSNIFQYENLNHIDKKRNIKRKSYNVFLEYLNSNDIITNSSFKTNKSDYISVINNYFPEANLMKKLEDLNELDKINKVISEKFNGNLVKEWIEGINGKELGNAIVKFKTALGDQYDAYIYYNNTETIREFFMKVYNGKN